MMNKLKNPNLYGQMIIKRKFRTILRPRILLPMLVENFDVQKHVSHITNLGKVCTNDELTNNLLRCLYKTWKPKVAEIMEEKDLLTMPLANSFGKLREDELELGSLMRKTITWGDSR
ncbi:hypothetical protein Lal_00043251 [Lupinus albus]|nr:hypothetical protein Lal_00043258 [Lupinus albus]KAF1883588.1 hypothetical protein Lal_00043251 [Lupinus albus]